MKPVNQILAERLLLERVKRSLKQSFVAGKTGVGEMTISRLERGENKRPVLADVVILAEFYNVTTDYLLGVGEK